ncbi:MAG: response regulator [Thermodesulfovibrionales bacterium]|nr:response regulator [Thermodesulfovibrionales bacterium]
MKILIADNSKETKEILNQMFLWEGHLCAFVEKGGEVMEEVYEKSPDIIILSLKFSKPNSFKILQTLKSAPSTRDIPVILIASKRILSLFLVEVRRTPIA